jgi:ubiquinone/menaquinone biosynthesis C-methylase UbiE
VIRVAKESLKSYFTSPGTIAKWWYPEEREGKYREHYIQQRLDIIRQVEPRNKNVLDVRTGKGRFAISFLRAEPKEVVAIDISREMIQNAKKMIEESKLPAMFVISDIEYLPFKDQTFDIVCCMQTIPHLPNPRKAMSEFTYVLKVGGVVVADTIIYRIPQRLLYHLYFHRSMYLLRRLAHRFFGKQEEELKYHSMRVINDSSKNEFTRFFRRVRLKIDKTLRHSIFFTIIAEKTS